MSTAEILAELPRLKAEDRAKVLHRLCELQEQDLLNGDAPTAAEKKLLDEELAKFEEDGHRGTPWREAMQRIRAARAS